MPRMTPTAKRAAVDLPETRVPAANAQVSRRRLLDQLSAAPRARLIVVQGPAGYGKTVLLRQYCEQRAAAGDKVAWVRDRKSVVEGKSVSVRVDLGGRRIIKKKIMGNDRYSSSSYDPRTNSINVA